MAGLYAASAQMPCGSGIHRGRSAMASPAPTAAVLASILLALCGAEAQAASVQDTIIVPMGDAAWRRRFGGQADATLTGFGSASPTPPLPEWPVDRRATPEKRRAACGLAFFQTAAGAVERAPSMVWLPAAALSGAAVRLAMDRGRSGLLDPVPPSWAPCLCMPWLAATAWLCYKALLGVVVCGVSRGGCRSLAAYLLVFPPLFAASALCRITRALAHARASAGMLGGMPAIAPPMGRMLRKARATSAASAFGDPVRELSCGALTDRVGASALLAMEVVIVLSGAALAVLMWPMLAPPGVDSQGDVASQCEVYHKSALEQSRLGMM
mmetsp:Transcript_41663/g.118014  ORF Transcript_41663/g.118014 Transcript_41663/m.118014 type:complete len:326 (+) Transcript_41663:120-1097(+)